MTDEPHERAQLAERRPARNYSWPPFEPGHELSMHHGAYSPRRVDPIATLHVEAVLRDADCAHAHPMRFRAALWAWARAEAQVQLLTEYLARAGEDSEDGVGNLDKDRVKSAYLLLHRAEARALSGRRALGLDPLSAARLGRDRAAGAVDTAKLMGELARLAGEGVEVQP